MFFCRRRARWRTDTWQNSRLRRGHDWLVLEAWDASVKPYNGIPMEHIEWGARRIAREICNEDWVNTRHFLGGHLKTGHRGSPQNRPTGRGEERRLLYRAGGPR